MVIGVILKQDILILGISEHVMKSYGETKNEKKIQMTDHTVQSKQTRYCSVQLPSATKIKTNKTIGQKPLPQGTMGRRCPAKTRKISAYVFTIKRL